VEGLSNGREKVSFEEEGKQSFEEGGRSKAARQQIGRGMSTEVVLEEEERLVVGELGRSLVAEQ